MNKFSCLIILSIIPLFSFCTTIFISMFPHAIYVAADSRSIYQWVEEGTGVVKSDTISICKIHNINSIYYAVSGHDDQFLTRQGELSIKNYKNLDESIKDFEDKIKLHYEKVMTFERTNYKKNFEYYLHNAIGAVSFFGFKKDVPYLITVAFRLKIINNQITIDVVVIKDQDTAYLGITQDLRGMSTKYFDAHIRDKRGMIYTLENGVKYEIKLHSKHVAPPIDLLELTASKANWIRKKHFCD